MAVQKNNMETSPDIHSAIEQLDATLHPKPTDAIEPKPIELTEEMRIASPAIDEETRQQLIAFVEQSIHNQLPQLIAEAVDQALSKQTDNTHQ